MIRRLLHWFRRSRPVSTLAYEREVQRLTVEADWSAREILRLRVELADARQEVRLAQAFARSGYDEATHVRAIARAVFGGGS
jgi:hypothetical protein